MKKIIDIPEDTKKKLDHICIDEAVSTKYWIERLIIKEVDKKSK